jgi:hypothetical protein
MAQTEQQTDIQKLKDVVLSILFPKRRKAAKISMCS